MVFYTISTNIAFIAFVLSFGFLVIYYCFARYMEKCMRERPTQMEDNEDMNNNYQLTDISIHPSENISTQMNRVEICVDMKVKSKKTGSLEKVSTIDQKEIVLPELSENTPTQMNSIENNNTCEKHKTDD